MWEIKHFPNKDFQVIQAHKYDNWDLTELYTIILLKGLGCDETWSNKRYNGLALTNLPPSYTQRIFAQSGVRQYLTSFSRPYLLSR